MTREWLVAAAVVLNGAALALPWTDVARARRARAAGLAWPEVAARVWAGRSLSAVLADHAPVALALLFASYVHPGRWFAGGAAVVVGSAISTANHAWARSRLTGCPCGVRALVATAMWAALVRVPVGALLGVVAVSDRNVAIGALVVAGALTTLLPFARFAWERALGVVRPLDATSALAPIDGESVWSRESTGDLEVQTWSRERAIVFDRVLLERLGPDALRHLHLDAHRFLARPWYASVRQTAGRASFLLVAMWPANLRLGMAPIFVVLAFMMLGMRIAPWSPVVGADDPFLYDPLSVRTALLVWEWTCSPVSVEGGERPPSLVRRAAAAGVALPFTPPPPVRGDLGALAGMAWLVPYLLLIAFQRMV